MATKVGSLKLLGILTFFKSHGAIQYSPIETSKATLSDKFLDQLFAIQTKLSVVLQCPFSDGELQNKLKTQKSLLNLEQELNLYCSDSKKLIQRNDTQECQTLFSQSKQNVRNNIHSNYLCDRIQSFFVDIKY